MYGWTPLCIKRTPCFVAPSHTPRRPARQTLVIGTYTTSMSHDTEHSASKRYGFAHGSATAYPALPKYARVALIVLVLVAVPWTAYTTVHSGLNWLLVDGGDLALVQRMERATCRVESHAIADMTKKGDSLQALPQLFVRIDRPGGTFSGTALLRPNKEESRLPLEIAQAYVALYSQYGAFECYYDPSGELQHVTVQNQLHSLDTGIGLSHFLSVLAAAFGLVAAAISLIVMYEE
jgi:hypothetical protein